MMTAKILLFIVVSLALFGPASGEHEVYYRYTVLGYVKDAQGTPLPGVAVSLTREKTGFAYRGQTNATGLYMIVARIGDESAGERLRLAAGDQAVTLVARFDPANHSEERGTRLDFQGGKSVERTDWFLPTLRGVVSE
jgi:Carboxypeptidase regulatory-like domain